MKKSLAILVAALIGAIAVVALNTTKVASNGFGVQIPLGWHETEQPVVRLGGPEANATQICSLLVTTPVGLPFADERQDVSACAPSVNYLARIMNLLVGAGLSALVGLLIIRSTTKRK